MSQRDASVCTLGATDAYIEGSSLIAVSRPSEAHGYTLHYRFAELEGYLDAQGAHRDEPQMLYSAGVIFPLPLDFYTQLPDRREGVCLLTCRSYLDAEPVGQPQTVCFRVTVDPSLCAPSLEASVEDCNGQTLAVTGNGKILVRYASAALCRARAEGCKGASIASLTVNGQEMEAGQAVLENVDSGGFTFVATDSRGVSSQVSLEADLVSYTQLSANGSAIRTDPVSGQAQILVNGKYFYGSFGASDNGVTAYVDVYGQQLAMEVVEQEGSFRASVQVDGLDYSRSHSLTVTVSDRVGSIQRVVYVPPAEPVFDWGQTDFAFHVPVTAPSFNETDVRTLYRGFCLDANDATLTGTYRIIPESTNTPFPGGILVSFFCGDLVLQLASNETGSQRYVRMLQTGTDHGWIQM